MRVGPTKQHLNRQCLLTLLIVLLWMAELGLLHIRRATKKECQGKKTGLFFSLTLLKNLLVLILIIVKYTHLGGINKVAHDRILGVVTPHSGVEDNPGERA